MVLRECGFLDAIDGVSLGDGDDWMCRDFVGIAGQGRDGAADYQGGAGADPPEGARGRLLRLPRFLRVAGRRPLVIRQDGRGPPQVGHRLWRQVQGESLDHRPHPLPWLLILRFGFLYIYFLYPQDRILGSQPAAPSGNTVTFSPASVSQLPTFTLHPNPPPPAVAAAAAAAAVAAASQAPVQAPPGSQPPLPSPQLQPSRVTPTSLGFCGLSSHPNGPFKNLFFFFFGFVTLIYRVR